MKINIIKILVPVALLSALIFTTPTMAQTASCTVNQPTNYYNQPVNYRQIYPQQKRNLLERFQNQKERIAEGVRDHSLTSREADMLKQRQTALEKEFVATAHVGYMTPGQYAHFTTELDQMSDYIYRAKHNAINQYNDHDHGYRPYPDNTRVIVQRIKR